MNKIGPSLVGVVGRKSGSEPGYNYSPALANITKIEKRRALKQFIDVPVYGYIKLGEPGDAYPRVPFGQMGH